MSKKLFGFGDSCTEGHLIAVKYEYQPFLDWKEYRGGNLPPVWIDLVGEHFDMEVVNYGAGGHNNTQIFHDFIEHMDEISKGDIVIVNWTHLERFRWATPAPTKPPVEPHDYWKKMSSRKDDMNDPISAELKDEIIRVRTTSNLYVEEVYDYQKVIEKIAELVGFEVFFWSIENKIIFGLPENMRNQKKYILHDVFTRTPEPNRNLGGMFFETIFSYGGQTPRMETNNAIPDTHLGESGHKVQSELFIQYLEKHCNFDIC